VTTYQVLFLSTLLPAAGSATTTFFPVATVALAPAFLFNAVLAADAALATPPFFLSAGLLVPTVTFVNAFVVAAVRPPRFGLMTVVPLEAVDMSVELLCILV